MLRIVYGLSSGKAGHGDTDMDPDTDTDTEMRDHKMHNIMTKMEWIITLQ